MHTKKQLALVLFYFVTFPFIAFATSFESPQELGFESSVLKGMQAPIPMASLDAEPSCMVHGCVNVISGHFGFTNTDLIVPHGVEPLTLDRTFGGMVIGYGTLTPGWFLNHLSYMRYATSDEEAKYVVTLGHGCNLPYKATKNETYQLSPKAIKRSVTNNASGYISGQTNIKNIQLHRDWNNDDIKTLKLGDGSYKQYRYMHKDEVRCRRIDSDTLASGNKIGYRYVRPDSKILLQSVSLLNSSKESAGEILFPTNKVKFLASCLDYKVTTDTGDWVNYLIFKDPNLKVPLLLGVENSSGYKEGYTYCSTYGIDSRYACISSCYRDDQRFLEINYYREGKNETPQELVKIKYSDEDPRSDRVRTLKAPAGTDATAVPIYHFFYHLNYGKKKNERVQREFTDGTSVVTDAVGNKIEYVFNALHRLQSVRRYNKNDKVYTKEWMEWGDVESANATNLLSHCLEQEGQGVVFAKTFTYDAAGNATKTDLFGNLSGHAAKLPSKPVNGKVSANGSEVLSKTCKYTNDGYNLLTEESDGFEKIRYVYAPKSNRLIAKFSESMVGPRYKLRSFYTYNEDSAVIKEVVDDGLSDNVSDLSGVTERHITYITPSKNKPKAFPLVIEKKALCLKTNKELLVHKVVNAYNARGKITKQEHYGSDDKLAYALKWEYDKANNVTSETDPLGTLTTMTYDLNNNCTSRKTASLAYTTQFTYDFMNRLIKEEELHSDGIRLATGYKYDLAGKCIAATDTNGNETNFAYDAHGRVVQVTFPKVLDKNGQPKQPTLFKEYDPMGNVVKEIDEEGFEIKRRHTIKGEMAETIYPDGSIEKKWYSLNGHLIKHIERNGVTTCYENDVKGRPTKINTSVSNVELITLCEYTPFHLVKETDPMGAITQYDYYPDGKLKTKYKGSAKTNYFYDPLGRLAKTHEYHGSGEKDYLVKAQDHDLLNRVIEERVEDPFGQVKTRLTNVYDTRGNLTSVTTYPNNAPSTTITRYDSRGQAIETVDPLGNAIHTHIKHRHINALQQCVACTEVTDSLGNTATTEYDALGRESLLTCKNAFGKEIQRQEKRYDKKGNLVKIIDTIVADGNPPQAVVTSMEYDGCNRITATIESLGTPEQKITRLTYTNQGQKSATIKADGTKIEYQYDALGLLSTLKSSDGTVHYSYTYDKNGRPVKIEDLITKKTSLKGYDADGNLHKDVLGNGLETLSFYDGLSRVKELTLPDGSGVSYSYDACFMKSVARKNPSGKTTYTHTYTSFDLSGKLLASNLIGSASTVSYSYDTLGRFLKSEHALWSETIEAYDLVGNILQKSVQKEPGAQAESIHFAYDDLYQLVKEEGVCGNTYSHDSHHRRLSKNGTKATLNKLHQLINDGIYAYAYDLSGNLIKKTAIETGAAVSYKYDAFDRLILCESSSTKAFYTYDDTHRRLSKTISVKHDGKWKEQEVELYLYHGQNEIGACNKEGVIKELRLLGIGKGAEIGAAVAIEKGSRLFSPLHDHMGNVSCIIDANTGEKVESYSYTAYGEELFETALISWRFSSKRFDTESGLVFFGRRYYDPFTGRWITPDPIGRDGGPNVYAYVKNNPLTHIDPYGLSDESLTDSPYRNNVTRWIHYAVEQILMFPGNTIAYLGHHLCPHPVVQGLLEFAGHCLRGGNPSAFKPSWKQGKPELLVHKGSGNNKDGVCHLYVSGILNDENNIQREIENLSKMYDGATVYGMYMPSHGLCLDVLGVIGQKLGFNTQPQREAHHQIHQLIEEMGEHKHHGVIVVEAHSRGCEIIHNLCPALKRMMFVDAYGPAKLLNREEYLGARNHVCITDPVPMLADTFGYMKGICSGSIAFLPTKGPFLECP